MESAPTIAHFALGIVTETPTALYIINISRALGKVFTNFNLSCDNPLVSASSLVWINPKYLLYFKLMIQKISKITKASSIFEMILWVTVSHGRRFQEMLSSNLERISEKLKRL